MPPNLLGLIIAAVGTIVTVGVAVGLPALAVIAVKYFKFRERELTLEMEHRQKSQQKDLVLEERMQRLEDALTALDHDVRVRLGIGPSEVPAYRAELFEGPATEQENPVDPIPIKAR
ncbi:MAG TPA: hypothetical protein VFA79_09590 [Myxococcales bacterium]|nr:hypothetical protein [Myxococcales bacterium]